MILNKRVGIPVVLTALLFGLSGCASMSEGECLTANWFDKGYSDGSHGMPLSLLADHAEACSKVQVTPNSTLYNQGRNEGLKKYCTPENVQREGRLGRSFSYVCPAHLESGLYRHYEDGKRVYTAEQKIDSLNRQSNELERKLRKTDDNDKRQRIRKELRELDRQLSRAREDMRYEERRLR